MFKGVNFTNILRAAFTSADPKKCTKDSQAVSLFALLGAASKMLVKSTPGCACDHIVTEKGRLAGKRKDQGQGLQNLFLLVNKNLFIYCLSAFSFHSRVNFIICYKCLSFTLRIRKREKNKVW